MSGTLRFPINDDFKRIVEHAENNDPGLYYGTKIPRSIYWVKDRGTYLMSAGQPGLRKDPSDPENKSQLVVYAEGHNPDTGEYDYDTTRAICGGDDFAEPIEPTFFRKAIDAGAKVLVIKVRGEQIELEFQS